jgi:3-oxoacyl-[acyl-carrier protein] reductase
MMDNLVKAGQGHILAVSSIYGSIARDRRSSYVMSKHALNGLIKTLAIELGRHNILVNAISPGFVDTAMTRSNNTVERIRQFENLIPLGRMAAPPEIARVAWFLCSRHNTYITGQDIVVDGGFMAGGFQPS